MVAIMKILLIQPPIRDFYTTKHRMYPLGLLYCASSLKAAGFHCDLLDAFSGGKKRRIPMPRELHYLKEFYCDDDKSPLRLFSHYYHFGLDDAHMRERIENADIVGISSLFTTYEQEVLRVAHIAKQCGKLVILGGNHATVSAAHCLENPHVDYVVLGEGEIRMVALCKALSGKQTVESIDGLGYKIKGRIKIQPPRDYVKTIDALPFPDRSLVDPGQYRFKGYNYTMILSSRGCPYGCTFCSSHYIMGRKIRFRSIENILEEMRISYRLYHIKVFDFEDDHFTVDRYRAIALLEAIEDEFGKDPEFQLLFENGLFPHSLNEELLSLMKRLQVTHLNLPLVTSSNKVCQNLNRPGSCESFADIVKRARHKFFITGYSILGLPESDREEMIQSIRFLCSQNVLIAPSTFYAVPGMELYEQCREKGLLPYDSFLPLRSSAFPLETDRFKRLDLVTLFRIVRAINFIKSCIDESTVPLNGTMRLTEFIRTLLMDLSELQLSFDVYTIKTSRSLSPKELGLLILSKWLTTTPRFYQIRKEKPGPNQWMYHLIPQKDSTIVWQQFLTIMHQTTICGIHNTDLTVTWDIGEYI
ncbi:MAG: B12-binding domain-containing radical SAM protein [bacterium]